MKFVRGPPASVQTHFSTPRLHIVIPGPFVFLYIEPFSPEPRFLFTLRSYVSIFRESFDPSCKPSVAPHPKTLTTIHHRYHQQLLSTKTFFTTSSAHPHHVFYSSPIRLDAVPCCPQRKNREEGKNEFPHPPTFSPAGHAHRSPP